MRDNATVDLLGVMEHGHADPTANEHYIWAVAEITALRNQLAAGRLTPPDPEWLRRKTETDPDIDCEARTGDVAQPVAWTNEHQLGYLKDPEWASVPMAMWGKSNGAARIPLYAAQPPAAPVETAVSSDGEPSNGKQPLMASRPAPPVPSDPQCSAGNAREPVAFINNRLADLAEANALYGKDQRLSAPDKIARNEREISWLKELRSIILTEPQAVAMPLGMKAHPNSGAPFNPRDDDAYPKDDGMAKSSAVSRPHSRTGEA